MREQNIIFNNNREIVDELDEIRFTFENCDGFEIRAKDIDKLIVNGLYKKDIKRDGKVICTINCCKAIDIIINGASNEEYYSFGLKYLKENKFSRIHNNKDITVIDLVYKNGQVLEIYTEYKEEKAGILGSPNILQSSEIVNGNLELKIGEI